ncbi:Phosphoserine phosphatase [Kickxella alabastrina]|nr:Phosphoserine phosphatase [Kickxella alabastrina]
MKYGNYLTQQQADFPAQWQTHFIDYTALKTFLKTQTTDTNVRLSTAFAPTHVFTWTPATATDATFDQQLSTRLAAVAKLTPQFIRLLDAQVQKFNNFFVAVKGETKKRVQHVLENGEDVDVVKCERALRDLLMLERFVYLNFTAVAKALKKHDKWTGLQVREPYLMRTSQLSFVQSVSLMQMKPALMAKLSAALVAQDVQPMGAGLPEDSPVVAHGMAKLRGMTEPAEPTIATAAGSTLGSTLGPLVNLMHDTQTVKISLRGPHGTDIIGSVLGCLTKHRCQIADFSLSRLHHDVTFGVLVHLPNHDLDLFGDLARTAQKWDGTLAFDIQDAQLKASQLADPLQYALSEAPYSGRNKFIATVLNERGLTPEFLSAWLNWLLQKKISVEQMRRLDGHSTLMCVEFRLSVPEGLSPEEMQSELIAISHAHQADVALQPDNVFRRQKRLVVFDMDSTLIQQEVIDEIARIAGIEPQVAAITERAMQGELDFKESLTQRVALLKGTPVDALEQVKRRLEFTEGAHYLCRALKNAGFKLAVISGGFLPLAKYVKEELGLDYAFANQLQVTADGKRLTGVTVGPVVDAVRKAELLEVIAQAEGIALDQVVAVGDGANDLLMLGKASLGIAFNAKPRVQKEARARINQKSLANILYLMGYSESEAAELQLQS